tara:strand:+ start:254 stop:520 length:267 start_codon:yes stop_codon:yes gene_type:complete
MLEKNINLINTLVWLKRPDIDNACWTLGVVKGFTNKMVKCEDITRPENTQSKNGVGNFKLKNVRLLTDKEWASSSYYKEVQKQIREKA